MVPSHREEHSMNQERDYKPGDVLEHTDRFGNKRRVRVMLRCLDGRYGVRAVATNRLSYVSAYVVHSNRYAKVEVPHVDA